MFQISARIKNQFIKKFSPFMIRLLFLSLFLFFSNESFSATDEPKEPLPLDPKYMGIHPMVLLNKGSAIFAYLLPTYKFPHNVQLLYKLDEKSTSLIQLVRDADMVTIKPKPFNLQRLIRGEKTLIETDVYIGHLDRDGLLTYESLILNFNKQLYVRIIDEPERSNTRQKYDSIKINNNERIIIHQIQTTPTYDQLIYLSDNISCSTEFNTSSSVPSKNEIYYKLSYCGSMKPLYYETENFK